MVRYFRNSAAPSDAARLARLLYDLDIRELLRSVTSPALVMYRTGWEPAEIEEIRHVGDLLPEATLVPLAGVDRPMWVGDLDLAAGEIQNFLTGVRPSVQPRRALATVMFTDIVDSTTLAAELGDARWRTKLTKHDTATRAEIDRLAGRWIKGTGDGVLATFDGPASGVRCAMAIRDALAPLGLRIRAGLHTGEVELIDDDIGGVAVAIGARIAAAAGAGEVWASSTVKDLTVGSGLVYQDAGRHGLKGVPDRWQLYRVIDDQR
jgi:class 3 adenylate cyclase